MANESPENRRHQNVIVLGMVSIAVLGIYIYFTSASNAARREGELTKVIHSYEESVFLKKAEIYREEVKRKEAEVLDEQQERKRLAGELVKANAQIDTANKELQKANKIIEDEAVAIAEWKAKTTQLESDFFHVRKERDELRVQNDELTDYAKKKDTALQLIMTSLQKSEDARQEAERMKKKMEKTLGDAGEA
mmetsp:Transcript_4706/g.13060  ORF Transcript_4706/g.13060 Transcript_4706/m.13060 type:complete len:193 (-) Transcript_4706:294-872(-)